MLVGIHNDLVGKPSTSIEKKNVHFKVLFLGNPRVGKIFFATFKLIAG